MMLSLVMLMVITVHEKKLKRHYILKMARGRLYTKEREKGRQCAERLIFSLDRDLFDNSDYDKSSKFFFNNNKKSNW